MVASIAPASDAIVGSVRHLRQRIEDLEQTNARMRVLFDGKPDRWKVDLVRLRKVQSNQLSALSESLVAWAGVVPDDPERDGILALFADMRRAIAMTQTEWPLSRISDAASLEAYTAASRQSIRASEAFFKAVQPRLGQL